MMRRSAPAFSPVPASTGTKLKTFRELPRYCGHTSTFVGLAHLVWDVATLTKNKNPQAAFEKTLARNIRFSIANKIPKAHPYPIIMTADPNDVAIVGCEQGPYPKRDDAPWPWSDYFATTDMPVSWTWMYGYEYERAIRLWKDRLYKTDMVLDRFGKHMLWHSQQFIERFAQKHNSASLKNPDWLKLCAYSLADQCNEMQAGVNLKWLQRDELCNCDAAKWKKKGAPCSNPNCDERYFVAVRDLGQYTIDVATKEPYAKLVATKKYTDLRNFWLCMFNRSKELVQQSLDEIKKNGGKPTDAVAKGKSIFQDILEYRTSTEPEFRMPSTTTPFQERNVIDSFERIAFTNLECIIGVMDPASQMVENIVLFLAKYPEYQGPIAAEVDAVLADAEREGAFTPAHWKRLVKFRCFMAETLRYFPLFDVHQRRLTTPTQLADGTYCPNGTRVIVNYGAMCKREESYPDPFTFNPARWEGMPNGLLPMDEMPHPASGKNGSMKCPFSKGKINNADAFCPFGLGDRRCAGIGWGQTISALVVLQMVRAYEIQYQQPGNVTVLYKNSTPSKPTPSITGYFTFVPRTKTTKTEATSAKK